MSSSNQIIDASVYSVQGVQEFVRVRRLGKNRKVKTSLRGARKKRARSMRSREQQDPTVWIDRFKLNSEFDAIQKWHRHVRDEEVRLGIIQLLLAAKARHDSPQGR